MVKLTVRNDAALKISITKTSPVNIALSNTTGGGIKNYEKLENKPSISGHTLVGDSSLEEIGVEGITDDEIHAMFK